MRAESLAMHSARRELEAMRAAGEIVPALYTDLERDITKRYEQAELDLAVLTTDAEEP